MNRMTRLAGALGAATVALIATPGTAAASFPAPDGPTWPPGMIELVQVPIQVPVDDRAAELLQMQIAAMVGAAVAALITAARRRRSAPTHVARRGGSDPGTGTTGAAASSAIITPPGAPVLAEIGRAGADDGCARTDEIWR